MEPDTAAARLERARMKMQEARASLLSDIDRLREERSSPFTPTSRRLVEAQIGTATVLAELTSAVEDLCLEMERHIA
jgi:hypothetical protein